MIQNWLKWSYWYSLFSLIFLFILSKIIHLFYSEKLYHHLFPLFPAPFSFSSFQSSQARAFFFYLSSTSSLSLSVSCWFSSFCFFSLYNKQYRLLPFDQACFVFQVKPPKIKSLLAYLHFLAKPEQPYQSSFSALIIEEEQTNFVFVLAFWLPTLLF